MSTKIPGMSIPSQLELRMTFLDECQSRDDWCSEENYVDSDCDDSDSGDDRADYDEGAGYSLGESGGATEATQRTLSRKTSDRVAERAFIIDLRTVWVSAFHIIYCNLLRCAHFNIQ